MPVQKRKKKVASKSSVASTLGGQDFLDIESELGTSVDIPKLLKSLDIDQDNLLQSASEAPGLFLMASVFRVKRLRLRAEAKSNLELTRSETSLRIRQELVDNGEKATEGKVSDMIASDPKVVALEKEFNEQTAEEEISKLLLEAMRIRRDSLKVISDLTGAERAIEKIHSTQTSELEKAKSKVKQKYNSM